VEGNFVGYSSALPVSVRGEPFRSIGQAAKHLRVDRKTLRKMLDEKRDPEIFWITKEENSLDESS
jgi:predicted transcriptional regulator